MKTLRIWIRAFVGVFLWGLASAQEPSPRPVLLHIEAQSIRAALQQFGRETGLQVLMRLNGPEMDVKASAVRGEFTVREGLDRLLAQTGLKYEFINEHTVRIAPVATSSSPALTTGEGARSATEGSPESFGRRFQLSQSDTSSTPSPKGGDALGEDRKNTIQEVIVTAQKRSENLVDVPNSITAISGGQLVLLRHV